MAETGSSLRQGGDDEEFAGAAALIPLPLLPRSGRRGERLLHPRPYPLTPSSSSRTARVSTQGEHNAWLEAKTR